jgi:hypothetical protein
VVSMSAMSKPRLPYGLVGEQCPVGPRSAAGGGGRGLRAGEGARPTRLVLRHLTLFIRHPNFIACGLCYTRGTLNPSTLAAPGTVNFAQIHRSTRRRVGFGLGQRAPEQAAEKGPQHRFWDICPKIESHGHWY